MTTLTRVQINPARRGGRKLLTDPQAMHAAVRASFPPDLDDSTARVLWRADKRQHDHVLYIVGPEKPTGNHLVEQAGWETRPAESADYQHFLDTLMIGQHWHFELVANPTYSEFEKGKRGKVRAHVSAEHQLNWLHKKATQAGFEVDTAAITERWTDHFHRSKQDGKNSRPVRIAKARFTGTLRVTDAAKLRTALTQGIGRARGYGCGLLTLAPVR